MVENRLEKRIVIDLPKSFIELETIAIHGANLLSRTLINGLLSDPNYKFLILSDANDKQIESFLSNNKYNNAKFIKPFQFQKDLLDFKPDLIFSTHFITKALFYARNILKLPIPIYSMIHLMGTYTHIEQVESFQKLCLPIDKCICPSKSVMDTIKEFDVSKTITNDQLVHIYHGVDTKQFIQSKIKNNLRRKYEIPEDSCVCLTLMRINPYTKSDLFPLTHAFESVLETNPNALLLIVGDDQSNTYVQSLKHSLKERGLENSIRLITVFEQNNIAEFYQLANIFISLIENPAESFGLTACEAMSAGCPVILSDMSFYKDHIEPAKHGFFIPMITSKHIDLDFDFYTGNQADFGIRQLQSIAFDMNTFINRLRYLINHPKKAEQMGLSARKRVLKMFSITGMIREYKKLFNQSSNIAIKEFPKLSVAQVKQKLGHVTSHHLRADTELFMTSYAKQVMTQEKQFMTFDRYFILFPEMVALLKKFYKKVYRVDEICKIMNLSRKECDQQLLFLMKHNLLAMKK